MNTQSDEADNSYKDAAVHSTPHKHSKSNLWQQKIKPKQIIARNENPVDAAVKVMASLSKKSSSRKSKHNVTEDVMEGQQNLPPYTFHDNLDLKCFLEMPVNSQYAYRI